jgi:hypothetical protein
VASRQCGVCRAARYCSAVCQKQHWRSIGGCAGLGWQPTGAEVYLFIPQPQAEVGELLISSLSLKDISCNNPQCAIVGGTSEAGVASRQ